MQRLSGMDAAFLYAETSSWHMHAGALMVFDPSTASEPFTAERVRAVIRSRLDQLGPLRDRIVEVPFGLDRPLRVAAADLDLHSHVREVGVPAPGGPHELARLVGGLFGPKLDRDRPLWELWFIEGLAEGHVALLAKVHHSMVDGVRGAALYETLFDLTPDAPLVRPGSERPKPERVPSDLELVGRALLSMAEAPVRGARAFSRMLGSGFGLAQFARTPAWDNATLPFQAPRTSLNQPITPRRGFAYCDVPLSDLKQVKNTFGVKLNDVVLAVCAGALRRYLSDRGELPDEPLVAQVPVAVQPDAAAEGNDRGNFVSVIGARIGTHLDDPVERLRAISESTASAKEMHAVMGDEVILDAAGVLPPAMMAAGVRAYTRMRLAEHHAPVFNLIVSNVPGPVVPLYSAGARLVGNYPLGPLLDGGGLNVTVLSYVDTVGFGFATCPDIVDDPWLLADAAVDAADELVRAAEREGAGAA